MVHEWEEEVEDFCFGDDLILGLLGIPDDETAYNNDPDVFCRDYWYYQIEELNEIEDRGERVKSRRAFLEATRNDALAGFQRPPLFGQESIAETDRIIKEVFAHNDGIPT